MREGILAQRPYWRRNYDNTSGNSLQNRVPRQTAEPSLPADSRTEDPSGRASENPGARACPGVRVKGNAAAADDHDIAAGPGRASEHVVRRGDGVAVDARNAAGNNRIGAGGSDEKTGLFPVNEFGGVFDFY